MQRIAGRPRIIQGLAAVAVLAWAVGLTVFYFAPGWGEPLRVFGGQSLEIGRPRLDAIGHLLAAVTVGLAGFGLGRPLAGWLLPEWRGAPRLMVALALGLGALSVVLLVFAAIGIYRPTPLNVLTIALAVAGAAQALRDVGRPTTPKRPRPDLLTAGFLALLALVAAFALVGALAPEVEYDALWYHLGFPAAWLRTGHLTDFRLQFVTAYPFSAELLYGDAMALGGEVAGKLTHLLFGVLMVGGVVDLGRRLFSPRAGLAGGLVVAVAPTILWEATTGNNDLAAAAFVVLAVDVAVASRARPTFRAAVAIGLLMSFAIGVKLLAGFALSGVALILLAGTTPAGAAVRTLRARVADVVIVGALAPLAVLPYLIRAVVLTGNPVFPSFYARLGADADRWTAESDRGLDQFLQHFGVGDDVFHFFALPWSLTMRTAAFGGTFGVFLLLLLPFALHRRPQRLELLVALTALIYGACWFFVGGTLQARFLIPAIALAGPFAGAGLIRLLEIVRALGRPVAIAAALGFAAVVVLTLPPFLPYYDRDRHEGKYLSEVSYETPLPYLLHGETRGDYLARRIPSGAADRTLAQLARPGDRVVVVSDSAPDQVHTDVEHVPSFAVGLEAFYDDKASDAEILRTLRRWRLRFVLADRVKSDALIDVSLLRPAFVRRHLRLVHQDTRMRLYEVR
jgi:hypothetical protein